MTYETVATFSQVTSLLMFIAMFAAVLVYALWPSNGPVFEEAQRQALDLQALDLDGNSNAGGKK
ncbi:MAG: cbb3-type cytochrome c oxidase subunit 3 [Hyphomicrobiaceae bacterium]